MGQYGWNVTREEFNQNRKKYIKLDLKRTLIAENRAINEFLGLFKNVRKSFRHGKWAKPPYLKCRDKKFVKSKWRFRFQSIVQSKEIGLEDARESIVIGRLLGYREEDILFYVIKNYIPKLYKILKKNKKMTKDITKEYPNLKRCN